MNRALLLFGHADQHTFNDQLATHYADGYRAAGGEVERIDLAALDFDPVLRTGYRAPQPFEPDLARVRSAIERADHLVWVFPTYWAAPPTIVRGLVDRVFLPGWAFRYDKGALPTGLLKGRSARVITTMDSPSWWYSLVNHRCIHRSFGTATLSFCGLAPLHFTTVHSVRELEPAAREKWCARVRSLAAADASRPRARPPLELAAPAR
jgi:NAD(P)H dehydrogenase (quinone)